MDDTDMEQDSNAGSGRDRNYLSIDEMVLLGIEAAAKIKRNSRESFMAWLDRAEWLWIGRYHYDLIGDDYKAFHVRLGIDRATAGWLPRLHPYRERVLAHYEPLADASAIKARVSRSADGFQWPGAKAALACMVKLYEPDKAPKAKAKPSEQTTEAETEESRKIREQNLREAMADRDAYRYQLEETQARLLEIQVELASEQNATEAMASWTDAEFRSWRESMLGKAPEAPVEASTDPVADDSGTADDSRQRGFQAATEAMAKATGGTVYEAGKAKADKPRRKSAAK